MNLLNVGVDCVFELLELQGETRVVGRGIGAELGDAGTVKAGMGAGEEQGDAQAEPGNTVAVSFGILSIMPCRRSRRRS